MSALSSVSAGVHDLAVSVMVTAGVVLLVRWLFGVWGCVALTVATLLIVSIVAWLLLAYSGTKSSPQQHVGTPTSIHFCVVRMTYPHPGQDSLSRRVLCLRSSSPGRSSACG
jgi:hypothetical protein